MHGQVGDPPAQIRSAVLPSIRNNNLIVKI
jgi:hypothetical protein